MTNINIDIKPSRISSAYINLPFDEGKVISEKENYRIISLGQNAKLRIDNGIDAYISKNGNYVREGAVYIPKKGGFLTKNSPIMKNAKEATECHRNNKEYYLTNDQLEEALSDSIELKGKAIPTNRFKDDEITNYAFGDIAQKYGDFLRENGIREMPVNLASLGDKPFAMQVWLHKVGLGSGSGLDCDGRNLDVGNRVRGVRELNAKGTKKNLDSYTEKQIKEALHKEGIRGDLEKRILKYLK